MKRLIILFLLLCGWPAWARLGETEQQLTNRYGAPVDVSTNGVLRALNFNFGEFIVRAYLREGKSVTEFAYLKKKGVDFDEVSALAIASRMSGATNWTPMDSGLWKKTWGIAKPALYASLSNEPGKPQSIMVATVEEMQRGAEERDEAAKKKAAGF